jgi:LmbE family N-acetylglucosaminyl deacetylase
MRTFDLNAGRAADDIRLLFPRWRRGDERLAVFSPHDDDALIGAGYAALAALANGGEVLIVIFSRGEAGYSVPEQKADIVAIRRGETIKAYGCLGIPRHNILTLGYSDFSVLEKIGWKLIDGSEGSFRRIVTLLRTARVTRVLIPNDYREHIDHTAVCRMGAYHTPQAGDPVCADWGAPYPCRGVLQYSVWADFSPEDALVCGRERGLRADRAILAPPAWEAKIRRGIAAYRSQGRIIRGLVAAREERRARGGYLEVYCTYDPRPKLNYKPYVRRVEAMKEAS